MQIALIGAHGQLGTDLLGLLEDDVVALDHDAIEITDPHSVHATLHKIRPDTVINAAAFNFVDRAEDEPELAYAVNALGPRNLAITCAEIDATLLHVSTDFVFGLETGRSTPLCETDAPGPVSAYGVSKLAGEYFVQSLCPRHFVVRTCGLYGKSAMGNKGNFVETMLRLGSERDELTVVGDQRCTPTSTADLATAIVALVRTDAFGLYHATSSGSMTWCEFAIEIFRQSGLQVQVKQITSAQFGAKAARPAYSVLDCTKLTATIGFELPPWPEALACYLDRRES